MIKIVNAIREIPVTGARDPNVIKAYVTAKTVKILGIPLFYREHIYHVNTGHKLAQQMT